jgi:hypothetical protein
MTHVIDTVFIDAILGRVLRELGLPKTLPLAKLSPRMQKWVLGEAACLQRDAMSHSTFALLIAYGYPPTRESYLNINNVDEDDLDAEQESLVLAVLALFVFGWFLKPARNQHVRDKVNEILLRFSALVFVIAIWLMPISRKHGFAWLLGHSGLNP